MVQTFRILVMLSVLAYVLFVLYPLIGPAPESPFAGQIISLSGYGSAFELPEAVDWAIIVLWILLAIGIYNFKRLARTGYLVLLILELAVLPFIGMQILTAAELFLFSIVCILDGAILAMAFFSSVSEKFAAA